MAKYFRIINYSMIPMSVFITFYDVKFSIKLLQLREIVPGEYHFITNSSNLPASFLDDWSKKKKISTSTEISKATVLDSSTNKGEGQPYHTQIFIQAETV